MAGFDPTRRTRFFAGRSFNHLWFVWRLPVGVLSTATARDDRVFYRVWPLLRAGTQGPACEIRRDRCPAWHLPHRMVPFNFLVIFLVFGLWFLLLIQSYTHEAHLFIYFYTVSLVFVLLTYEIERRKFLFIRESIYGIKLSKSCWGTRSIMLMSREYRG